MSEFTHKYDFFQWLSYIENVHYIEHKRNSLLHRLSVSRQLTYKEKLKNDIKADIDTNSKNNRNNNLYLVVPNTISWVRNIWDSFRVEKRIKRK